LTPGILVPFMKANDQYQETRFLAHSLI